MGNRNRQSIRLPGYDYCMAGIYFVTICTKYRNNIFGRVKNGRMILNKYGLIARDEWIKTAQIRANVEIDEFIIMPDHMHGILVIFDDNNDEYDNNRGRGMTPHAPTDTPMPIQNISLPMAHQIPNDNYGHTTRQFGKPIAHSLPTIIGAYKSSVTREINKMRKSLGGIVWQRNYYEKIVRTDKELMVIRKYIINNSKF